MSKPTILSSARLAELLAQEKDLQEVNADLALLKVKLQAVMDRFSEQQAFQAFEQAMLRALGDLILTTLVAKWPACVQSAYRVASKKQPAAAPGYLLRVVKDE